MINASARGEVLKFTAPAGGVVSGQAYMIGSILVVAAADALEDAEFEGLTVGVFRVPKPDDEAWSEGDPVYFDAAVSPEPLFTVTAVSPALPLVGVAVEEIDASPAQATGLVRLDGAAR